MGSLRNEMKGKVCLIFLLLLFKFIASYVQSLKLREKKKSSSLLVSNLQLKFSDKRAMPILNKWATELAQNGNTVTHGMAVAREREVVRNVQSGIWNPVTYHEYQRMAAGSGNVDSAKLLIEYGVSNSIRVLSNENKRFRNLLETLRSCNMKLFMKRMKGFNFDELQLSDGTNVMLAAIEYGCTRIVRYLLETETLNVEHSAMNGVTPLMLAASKGYVEIIWLLVKIGGASLTTAHKFAGTTALHMAAELDQYQAIRALCGLGDELGVTNVANQVTSTGSSALHTAAHVGALPQTIHALLQQKQHYTKDDFGSLATMESFSAFVRQNISGCSMFVDVLMNGDTTSLYLASQHGHPRTVQALLDGGANINFVMPRSQYKGSKYLTKLTSGLDNDDITGTGYTINSEPGNGAQPAHAAAEEGHHEVLHVLLSFDKCKVPPCIDIDSMSMGVTALHLAVQYNRLLCVKVLVEAGAQSLPALTDGGTPLYYASGKGYVDIAEVLLKDGNVRPHGPQSQSGAFPLLYAALTGHAKMITLLRKYGADRAEQIIDSGLTALHVAIRSNKLSSVRALIRNLNDKMSNTCIVSGEASRLSCSFDELNYLFLMTHQNETILHFTAASTQISKEVSLELTRKVFLLDHFQPPVRFLKYFKKESSIAVSPYSIVSDEALVEVNFPARISSLSKLLHTERKQDNYLALHVAIENADEFLISLLIAYHRTLLPSSSPFCPFVRSPTRWKKPSQVGPSFVSPLVLAVETKQINVLRLLLNELDCSVDGLPSGSADDNLVVSINPLLSAIELNNVEMVSILLAANWTCHDDNSSIGRTCSTTAMADQGINGGGIYQSPLLLAVVKGYSSIVETLLRHEANCAIVIGNKNKSKSVDTLVDVSKQRRDYSTLQALMSFPQCHPDNILKELKLRDQKK